jgi:hypothetical protein
MPLGNIISNAVTFRAWDINGNQTLWSPMHMLLDESAAQITKANGLPVAGGYPVAASAVIASSGNLSGAINLGNTVLAGLILPGTWDAAVLTFQGSIDGSTYADIYDGTTERSLTTAGVLGKAITLDSSTWMAWRYIKIRSGTAGTPVTQTAQRTISLVGVQ